jgi:hypothetical protein
MGTASTLIYCGWHQGGLYPVPGLRDDVWQQSLAPSQFTLCIQSFWVTGPTRPHRHRLTICNDKLPLLVTIPFFDANTLAPMRSFGRSYLGTALQGIAFRQQEWKQSPLPPLDALAIMHQIWRRIFLGGLSLVESTSDVTNLHNTYKVIYTPTR